MKANENDWVENNKTKDIPEISKEKIKLSKILLKMMHTKTKNKKTNDNRMKQRWDSEEKLLRQSAFKLLLSIFALENVLVTHQFFFFSHIEKFVFFVSCFLSLCFIYTRINIKLI